MMLPIIHTESKLSWIHYSNISNEKPIGLLALKADKELDKIVPKLRNKFSKLIVTSKPEAGTYGS